MTIVLHSYKNVFHLHKARNWKLQKTKQKNFLIIKTFLYNQIYVKLFKAMLNENIYIKFNQSNVYYLDYKWQTQNCKVKEKQIDRKSGKMYA